MRRRYGKGRQNADADDLPAVKPFYVGALLLCSQHSPAVGCPCRSRRLLRSRFNSHRHHCRLRHTEKPFRRRNRLLHAQHHAGGRRRTVSGNDLSRKRRLHSSVRRLLRLNGKCDTGGALHYPSAAVGTERRSENGSRTRLESLP